MSGARWDSWLNVCAAAVRAVAVCLNHHGARQLACASMQPPCGTCPSRPLSPPPCMHHDTKHRPHPHTRTAQGTPRPTPTTQPAQPADSPLESPVQPSIKPNTSPIASSLSPHKATRAPAAHIIHQLILSTPPLPVHQHAIRRQACTAEVAHRLAALGHGCFSTRPMRRCPCCTQKHPARHAAARS